MSGSQRAIRIISIIMIVIAGLSLILCGLLWALTLMFVASNASEVTAGMSDIDLEYMELGLGALLILAGVGTLGSLINLGMGIFGCVVARNKRMVSGLFRKLCIVIAALSLAATIGLVVTGAIEFPGALGIPLELIIMVVLVLMTGNVQRELKAETEWRRA